MMGGGEGWNGKYTPVEYFDTLRECKAAAKRYIDGSVNSDVSWYYKKPEGTVYAYRHFRCVPEGVSVDAIGDDDNSLRIPLPRPRALSLAYELLVAAYAIRNAKGPGIRLAFCRPAAGVFQGGRTGS